MTAIDEEIASLNQLHAHLLCKEGVFEIGTVVGTGGEHDNGRIGYAFLRNGAQGVEQQVGIVFDRRHAMFGKEFREEPHHHLAVFDHVRDAGRHAQIVFQHVVLARSGTHHIDARNRRVDVAGHIDALHLGAILCVIEHLLGRNAPRLEDFLIVVDVVDEGIQRLHTLAQTRRHVDPFLRGDDARNDIERNQALSAFRFAIDSEGNAATMKQRISRFTLVGKALRWRRL